MVTVGFTLYHTIGTTGTPAAINPTTNKISAIIPIITIMGPTVAGILTGTFVIESIFAIPGMGKYYVDSINANDYTLIMGMTLFYGAVLILANMIVDILYGIVDPRIRVDKKSEA